MIEHKEEIFSRPKKTWFITEREKKLMAKATKVLFLDYEVATTPPSMIPLTRGLGRSECRQPYPWIMKLHMLKILVMLFLFRTMNCSYLGP